ncbi:MAG TPA: hypothetical protein VF519_15920 [Mycobacteriales bacterium]
MPPLPRAVLDAVAAELRQPYLRDVLGVDGDVAVRRVRMARDPTSPGGAG